MGHGALRRQTSAASRPGAGPGDSAPPGRTGTWTTALNYLMGRGLHPVILDYCVKHRLLYESAGITTPSLWAMTGPEKRATLLSGAPGAASRVRPPGSDKRYAFSISEYPDAEKLHVFESAIDLLSFGTLALMEGHIWNQDHLLSLAGICPAKRGAPFRRHWPGSCRRRQRSGRSACIWTTTHLAAALPERSGWNWKEAGGPGPASGKRKGTITTS